MRDTLIRQFDAVALPLNVADLLEHAHVVARGTDAAIRVVRMSAVQRELGEAVDIVCADADHLLALAGAASALLGDRLEALSAHECDKSRRVVDAEQSSRGDA